MLIEVFVLVWKVEVRVWEKEVRGRGSEEGKVSIVWRIISSMREGEKGM